MTSNKSTKSTVTKPTASIVSTKNTKSSKSTIKPNTSINAKKNVSQATMIKSAAEKTVEKSQANMHASQTSSSSKKIANWKIVIPIVLIGLIVLMALCSIVFFALPHKVDESTMTIPKVIATTTIPTEPPKTIFQIQNMTEICQKKFGHCWTSKEKFVLPLEEMFECSAVKCQSLVYWPKVNILNETSEILMRLEFVIEDLKKSPKDDEWGIVFNVPSYTPCLDENDDQGWCIGEECVKPTDQKEKELLIQYNQIMKVNGGWETHQHSTDCISELDEHKHTKQQFNSTHWNNHYMKNQNCSNSSDCMPYAFSFRSCTNPSPQLGGEQCSRILDGTDNRAHPNDYPLIISKNCTSICHNRPPNETIQLNCPLLIKTDKYKDTCETRKDDFKDGKAKTDFKKCCYKGYNDTDVRDGLCLLGSCWPFYFS